MLKNDSDNLSAQSKQRILVENSQQTDKLDIKEFDVQQEVVEIQANSNSKENSITYDELKTKCQKLELDLKNAKQNDQKLIKKIKILEEQETNHLKFLAENFDKIQQLESELQKQQEQILSQELIIKGKQEQINKYEIKNTQLRSQLQEYNQLQKKRIKQFQDSYEINQNSQHNNCRFQSMKQNNQRQDLILIEKLKIKDNLILYLQNQLAELQVSKILENQEKLNQINLNPDIHEQKIAKSNSHKNLITQTSEKSLIQSQILTNQALPPKADQRLVQSQYNQQKSSFDASINFKNQEDFQGNNKSLLNLNESITHSINEDYQSSNRDY
ncbi:unnamed protein product [Paramecium pentaurelia]|uniref:Uncharacterized protein n=1 Tax=Paramecium pentaurelia TaxID=43138 RepID=A0A8S1UZ65_9CILI|nr:unnamed protein product [Paramecium pentaurelia]